MHKGSGVRLGAWASLLLFYFSFYKNPQAFPTEEKENAFLCLRCFARLGAVILGMSRSDYFLGPLTPDIKKERQWRPLDKKGVLTLTKVLKAIVFNMRRNRTAFSPLGQKVPFKRIGLFWVSRIG